MFVHNVGGRQLCFFRRRDSVRALSCQNRAFRKIGIVSSPFYHARQILLREGLCLSRSPLGHDQLLDLVDVDDNQTNNSSIVSKRSVERLYYPEPYFFRYFVKKPQRRSPLINRGYWMRMHAIDTVIQRFLDNGKLSHKRKVVINLGCG